MNDTKKPTPLSFKKPSGESRLTYKARAEISKPEVTRVSLDLPSNLAQEVKIAAIKESSTMKELIINAINNYLANKK